MAASAAAGAQGAVEEAISIAQDAVRADEAGDFDEAVELYMRAVELIKRGLQIQREDESVDNTVLHRYAKLYSDRIAVLAEHSRGKGGGPSSSGAAGSSGSAFSFDDEEIAGAHAPGPAPTEEWRRPFWLMRILHTSMSRGGFLSPDRRVYVAKRVWLQKGARFIALQASAIPEPSPNPPPSRNHPDPNPNPHPHPHSRSRALGEARVRGGPRDRAAARGLGVGVG